MEKDAEILSVGKIAESARFAEEEDLSLKTAVCLIERSELWIVAFLTNSLWQEGKFRLTLMRVGST